MEAAAATLVRPEERAQARAGDREAFVSLYEPDFGGLFDLLLRTLRDRAQATAALGDALECGWDDFREHGAPFDVRGWLYTLARYSALARPAKRRTTSEEREGFEYTRVDGNRLSDPTAAFDRELIELVWDEARTYSRDDYCLLDLHVRRDMSVDELADWLDLSRDDVAGRLSWLCDSLNEEIAGTLLWRRARHSCERLDVELATEPSNPGRAVRHHLRECDGCRETKRRFVSATEVLGSFALVPAPPGLRRQIAGTFLTSVSRRRRKLR